MEAFIHDRSPFLYYYVECGYSVAVRKTFGPDSGGRSKETERGERYDQHSTTITKRPVCYKKATKTLFVCLLAIGKIKSPTLTNAFLRFTYSLICDFFCAVAFSLCMGSTSYDIFSLLDGAFSTLFWMGWIFTPA